MQRLAVFYKQKYKLFFPGALRRAQPCTREAMYGLQLSQCKPRCVAAPLPVLTHLCMAELGWLHASALLQCHFVRLRWCLIKCSC